MSNDHIPDVTKMIQDTPRTDAEAFLPHDSKYRVCDADFARQLERELNAAQERIKMLKEELMDAKNKYAALVADVALYEDRADRIKRLEEALTEKRDKAEQRYVEEQNDGDGISVASTRAYYLALKEALIEIDKSNDSK